MYHLFTNIFLVSVQGFKSLPLHTVEKEALTRLLKTKPTIFNHESKRSTTT